MGTISMIISQLKLVFWENRNDFIIYLQKNIILDKVQCYIYLLFS